MTLQRKQGLARAGGLKRRTGPARGGRLAHTTPLERTAGLERNSPVNPVSGKRRVENQARRKMIAALYPERPKCAVPWCLLPADDIHEPLTRARGGSITDPENAVPLCRGHHDDVTFRPESELGWAYDLGLLIHSWNARPANGGEAA